MVLGRRIPLWFIKCASFAAVPLFIGPLLMATISNGGGKVPGVILLCAGGGLLLLGLVDFIKPINIIKLNTATEIEISLKAKVLYDAEKIESASKILKIHLQSLEYASAYLTGKRNKGAGCVGCLLGPIITSLWVIAASKTVNELTIRTITTSVTVYNLINPYGVANRILKLQNASRITNS